MIRHIVAFTLAETQDDLRATQIDFICSQLESLVPLVPELLALTTVRDVRATPGNSDVALIADYEDQAALYRYQVHPEHVKVSASIKPLLASRATVDFEV